MPSKKKVAEEMKQYLDAMEISKLHQMEEAAKLMDLNDKNGAIVKEDEDGDE